MVFKWYFKNIIILYDLQLITFLSPITLVLLKSLPEKY